jgi:hypothetical protein
MALVNYRYTSKNNLDIQQAISDNIIDEHAYKENRAMIYNEITISNNDSDKLRIYFSKYPVDLRIAYKNKIFYLNNSAVSSIENNINTLAGNIKNSIQSKIPFVKH